MKNIIIVGLIVLFFPLICVVLLYILIERYIFSRHNNTSVKQTPYVFCTQNTFLHETKLLKEVNLVLANGFLIVDYDKEAQKTLLKINASMHPKGFYCWDGCSPKIKLWGMIIGTPEGKLNSNTLEGLPITYKASLFHDVFYENRKVLSSLITRKEADLIFYELLQKESFDMAWWYYCSVRIFGWSYWYSFKSPLSKGIK